MEEKMNPREKILSAAADYLLQQGALSDSIREIAKNIGTSHRMINYHFAGNDEFWQAVVNEIRKKEITRIKTFKRENASALSISSYIETMTTKEYKKVFSVVLEIYLKCLKNPEKFIEFKTSFIDDWVRAVGEMIVAEKNIEMDAAKRVARFRLALVRGIMMDYFISNDKASLIETCQIADAIMLSIVKSNSTPAV